MKLSMALDGVKTEAASPSGSATPKTDPSKTVVIQAVPPGTEAARLFTTAVDLDRHGRSLDAIKSYDAALALGDKDLPPEVPRQRLLSAKGVAQSHLGQNAQALESFDAALRLDSGFGPAQYNKATTLLKMGRTNEALESLGKALAPGSKFEAKLREMATTTDDDWKAMRADPRFVAKVTPPPPQEKAQGAARYYQSGYEGPSSGGADKKK